MCPSASGFAAAGLVHSVRAALGFILNNVEAKQILVCRRSVFSNLIRRCSSGLFWRQQNVSAGLQAHPSAQLAYAKHNGFPNFERVRRDARLPQKIVHPNRLEADLDSASLPNFAEIVLNQCHEMHGLGADLPQASAPPPEDRVLCRAADECGGEKANGAGWNYFFVMGGTR
jgi:hypothetical protein